MGGKNHQPTRPSLIAASAWLSQQIGEGVILVNESNNSLENSIILAMDKLVVSLNCLDGYPGLVETSG